MLLNINLENYLDKILFKNDMIIVTTFYKFLELKNYEKLKIKLDTYLFSTNIKGTILLAKEGINATIAGNKVDMNNFLAHLSNHVEFKDLKMKFSTCFNNPFLRMKVRLKKEIITLGIPNIKPEQMVGKYLNTKEWNHLIQDKDSLIIDTRNDYEVSIGTFKSSINPKIKTFKEFPNWVNKSLINKGISKNSKIGMFCTGGIRCEKSTSYLKKLGFKNVFLLEGGILKYLEKEKNNKNFWLGECFVFDYRVSLNKSLEKGKYDMCYACRMPITNEDKMNELFKKGKSCRYCYNKLSMNQKNRFNEREKQIEFAKKRKQRHFGPSVNV